MRKRGLTFGIGINDADYRVVEQIVVMGRTRQQWKCPFYRTWSDMLSRCYSKTRQLSKPSYVGCSVVQEWHRFSTFKKWMLTQDWEGKSLDKDILFIGNRIYGPDTCIFVSSALNSLMHECKNTVGDYPLGVCFRPKSKRFHARCSNPFTGYRDHLGFFPTAELAHAAWRAKKHQHACVYADMQSDPRIAKALRSIYAPLIQPEDYK